MAEHGDAGAAADAGAGDKIRVEVVHAMADGYACVPLALDAGSTVADALAHAPALSALADPRCLAVHGQRVALDAVLSDGDRIELLRPLLADPRAVRRQRAAAAAPRRKR